jgi:hypothetical protein
LLPFGAEPSAFWSAVKKEKIKVYKTIILPVVLYGCESWSLTLKEDHRPRVFENRVLRRIFGPKTDEVTGECQNCITRRVVDWICLAQDRNRWRTHVNSVLNLRVPLNSEKLSRGVTTGGLSSVLSSTELVSYESILSWNTFFRLSVCFGVIFIHRLHT